MKRIVITGVGLTTALGLGAPATWESLVAGRSGVRAPRNWPGREMHVHGVGELPQELEEQACKWLDPLLRKRADRFSAISLVTATEAIEQARAGGGAIDSARFGVITGVGLGSPCTEDGEKICPTTVLRRMPNAAAAWIAIEHGLRGGSFNVSSACASGAHAIGQAFDAIRLGHMDACVAGGADLLLVPDVLKAFAAMRALNDADEPAEALSRPFDARRRGFVMAEGAGYVVLETLEGALARGARPIAELAGWGMSSDAHHIVAPAPGGEGAARAIAAALRDAGLAPEDVDYVSAHGTSTRLNDKTETLALKAAFGEHATALAISSQKSMLGHAIGGAGAIEAVVTALSLAHQVATPTINLEHADVECDLDYVAGRARRMTMRAAISNSFGFGGHNCVLALRRCA